MLGNICIIHIPQRSRTRWKPIDRDPPSRHKNGKEAGVEDVLLQRFTQAEDTRGEFVCNYAHGSLFAILHAPSSMHIQTSPLRVEIQQRGFRLQIFQGFPGFRNFNFFICDWEREWWWWVKAVGVSVVAAYRPKLKGWWRSSTALSGFLIWKPWCWWGLCWSLWGLTTMLMIADMHSCDQIIVWQGQWW